MIFYTLQGPGHKLEIHEDKLRLVGKLWFSSSLTREWEIKDLSQFQITSPKLFIISGKIKWRTFDGDQGQFRFSTNAAMVKKIESYMQKRILKNLKNKNSPTPVQHKQSQTKPSPLAA